MPNRVTHPPDDPETARLFAALSIATGRREDRLAPNWSLPYAADVVGMLLGHRDPVDDRERRALASYQRRQPGDEVPLGHWV